MGVARTRKYKCWQYEFSPFVSNLSSYQIINNYLTICLLHIPSILFGLLIHSVNFLSFYHFLFFYWIKKKNLRSSNSWNTWTFSYMVFIQGNDQQIWTVYTKTNKHCLLLRYISPVSLFVVNIFMAGNIIEIKKEETWNLGFSNGR